MKFAIAVAAIALACASQAAAQDRPVGPTRTDPPRISAPVSRPSGVEVQAEPDAPMPSTPDDVRRLHDFAQCVANRRTQEARRVLEMDFRTAEYREAIVRLATTQQGCANFDRGRMSQRFFAGRVAEALLPASLGGAPLSARVAPDPSRFALAARDESELMSLCTVMAAPDLVAALFATPAASDAELAAVRALVPAIGPCLSAGVEGRFNRSAIRSMLALAAYRLSENNRPAAVASTR